MKPTVIILTIAALTLGSGITQAEEHAVHSHTHIGRNQDQTWNNADDNKLWFFSMPGTPGWPAWSEPLPREPTGVIQNGKQLYLCQTLSCWHSGHPEHGNWQLGGMDPQTPPDWDIYLRRVAFDSDFFMLDSNEQPILTADDDSTDYGPDELALGSEWIDDKYNEQGTLGAWAIHTHTYFYAWASGPDEVFDASFQAVDYGQTGFEASDPYTMSFVTVPEPLTVTLLLAGLTALSRRRTKR